MQSSNLYVFSDQYLISLYGLDITTNYTEHKNERNHDHQRQLSCFLTNFFSNIRQQSHNRYMRTVGRIIRLLTEYNSRNKSKRTVSVIILDHQSFLYGLQKIGKMIHQNEQFRNLLNHFSLTEKNYPKVQVCADQWGQILCVIIWNRVSYSMHF